LEVSYDVTLPATFTNLHEAKEKAKAILLEEGYEQDFFSVYQVNNDKQEWTHGDGMMVYAQGPSNELFKVEIDTVPNSAGFEPDDDGRVRRPLHHVMETIIRYLDDRSGSERDTVVESVHSLQNEAKSQALKVLLDSNVKKEDFEEYDEYTDEQDGPFGPEVIVHAVNDNGENLLVSVISDYHM